jgi:hypothetical protein
MYFDGIFINKVNTPENKKYDIGTPTFKDYYLNDVDNDSAHISYLVNPNGKDAKLLVEYGIDTNELNYKTITQNIVASI